MEMGKKWEAVHIRDCMGTELETTEKYAQNRI